MISVLLAVMPVFFIRIVVIGGGDIVSVLEPIDVVHGRRSGRGRRNNNAHAHGRS